MSFKLADYFDRTVILAYDKRMKAEGLPITRQLFKYDYSKYEIDFVEHTCKTNPSTQQIFLCGGTEYPKESYDYIDEFPPAELCSRPQAYNYARCFKQIVAEAKRDGVRRLFFLEDDAELTPEFEELFPKAMKEVEPYGYDALFVGGIHCNAPAYKVTEHIILPMYSLDLHAIALNHTIFDDILSYGECYHHTFDGAFTNLQKNPSKRIYAIQPCLVIQRPCLSYNSGKMEDKRHYYFGKVPLINA